MQPPFALEDPLVAFTNKHQQRTEATKKKLLASALRIFARDGFEAARIEDIAVDAGYTRGAFYAHFQSKEDLFFALLEHQSERYIRLIEQNLEKCATDEERLSTLREFYVNRAADRQWTILGLEFKLYALRHPKLRAQFARRHRNIRSKLKWQAVDRLWPKNMQCAPESTDVRKLSLHAVLNGLVLEQAYDPASLSNAQVAAVLHRLFDFLVT